MSNQKNLFSQYRKDKGLRQKDVAEYLNVAEATYANWEQGRTEPDLQSLKKLSELYDASINQLLGLEDQDLILTSKKQYDKINLAKTILEDVLKEMKATPSVNIKGDRNKVNINTRVRKK